MGFDDIRPRAKVYDTWGLIGSLHRAPEPKPETIICVADPEEGGSCDKPGCVGTYELAYPEGGCRCFINAPCERCTSSYLVCSSCRYQPDEEVLP